MPVLVTLISATQLEVRVQPGRVFGSTLLSLQPPWFSISPIPRMSQTVLDPGDVYTLKYIITHVFCPLQLPDGDDHSIRNDLSLARAIATAARLYSDHVVQANLPQWHSISRMLENLQAIIIQSKSLDSLRFQTISQFSSMDVGGKFLSFHDILEAHIV